MREPISKWSSPVVDPEELASSASSTSSDDDVEEPAAEESQPMSSSCSSNSLDIASSPRANRTYSSIPRNRSGRGRANNGRDHSNGRKKLVCRKITMVWRDALSRRRFTVASWCTTKAWGRWSGGGGGGG
jgi:hypothetical protein